MSSHKDRLMEALELDTLWAVKFNEALPYVQDIIGRYLGIFTVQPGDGVHTDGETITLRPLIKEFKDKKDLKIQGSKKLTKEDDDFFNNRNLRAYLADATHEVLHIIEGSFLVNMKELFSGYERPKFMHKLTNIIEDGRIQQKFEEYGDPVDVNRLINYDLWLIENKRDFRLENDKKSKDKKPKDGEPEAFDIQWIGKDEGLFELFLQEVIIGTNHFKETGTSGLEQYVNEPVENEELAQRFGNRGELLDYCVQRARSCFDGTVYDSVGAADEIYDIFTKEFKPESLSGIEGEGTPGCGGGNCSHDFDNPDAIHVKDMDDLDAKKGEIEGLVEVNKERKRQGYESRREEERRKERQERREEDKRRKEEEKPNSVETYSGNFRRGPDLTYEIQTILERKGLDYMNKFWPAAAALKSGLNSLIKDESEYVHSIEDGMDLNIEGIVDLLADRNNLPTNTNIFDGYEINERDYQFIIAVDCSTSTNEEIGDGMRVMDVERATAGIIYYALTEHEIETDLWSFSTPGSNGENIMIQQFPGLEELADMDTIGGNLDGPSLRVIGKNYFNDPKKKFLIYIADGECDTADASMAIKQLRENNIYTIFLNVNGELNKEAFDTISEYTIFAQYISSAAHLPQYAAQIVRSVVKCL